MKKLNKIEAIPKKTLIVWWILRGALLIWGIFNLFNNHTTQFLQAIFAIAFTHLWDMFQLFGGRSFITRLPYRFQTQLNWFICIGCVVGTTLNLYTRFTHSDIIFHFLAGYIAVSASYELGLLVQGKYGKLSPALASMFSLAFGITILVGWEFYEFTMDRLYGMKLQMSDPMSEYGLIDTMVDLIVGAAGALTRMFVNIFTNIKNKKAG